MYVDNAAMQLVRNLTVDPTFRTCDRPVAHNSSISDANLPGQNHPMTKLGATGDANLRRQSTTAPSGHPMANLHKVVDFGAGTDACFAHGRAIDCAATAHLHSVL